MFFHRWQHIIISIYPFNYCFAMVSDTNMPLEINGKFITEWKTSSEI